MDDQMNKPKAKVIWVQFVPHKDAGRRLYAGWLKIDHSEHPSPAYQSGKQLPESELLDVLKEGYCVVCLPEIKVVTD